MSSHLLCEIPRPADQVLVSIIVHKSSRQKEPQTIRNCACGISKLHGMKQTEKLDWKRRGQFPATACKPTNDHDSTPQMGCGEMNDLLSKGQGCLRV